MKNLVSVDIAFLSSFREFPFDIFFKVSEKKFVRLINKDEVIGDSFFRRYIDKGCQVLWIDKIAFEAF